MTDELLVRKIQDLGIGYCRTQALYVAAKLGIADRLQPGAKTAEELAAEVDANGPALHRVLRFLTSFGVFELDDQARFALNPASELLLTNVQGSMRDWMIMLGEEFYEAWGKLIETVRDGKEAFRHAFGKGLFEYLEGNPDYARTFNRGMAAGSTFFQAVPDAYDFSRFRRVVDVGGGNGAMLAAILTANPEMTGVLFDAPSVVQAAKDNLEAQGLLHRCELVAGDFFKSIPEGGEVYMFSRILHDWNDEDCVTILSNCRKATGSSGRALIVERLIPSASAITSDVNMLAFTGGRERSENEFAELLAGAGFELTGVTPLPLEANIVEAVPR